MLSNSIADSAREDGWRAKDMEGERVCEPADVAGRAFAKGFFHFCSTPLRPRAPSRTAPSRGAPLAKPLIGLPEVEASKNDFGRSPAAPPPADVAGRLRARGAESAEADLAIATLFGILSRVAVDEVAGGCRPAEEKKALILLAVGVESGVEAVVEPLVARDLRARQTEPSERVEEEVPVDEAADGRLESLISFAMPPGPPIPFDKPFALPRLTSPAKEAFPPPAPRSCSESNGGTTSSFHPAPSSPDRTEMSSVFERLIAAADGGRRP